jgi:4-diphosphocytidyl-2C-methyl-D-erythritol kinase
MYIRLTVGPVPYRKLPRQVERNIFLNPEHIVRLSGSGSCYFRH